MQNQIHFSQKYIRKSRNENNRYTKMKSKKSAKQLKKLLAREAVIQFQLNSLMRMAERITSLIRDLESMRNETIEKVNKVLWEEQ